MSEYDLKKLNDSSQYLNIFHVKCPQQPPESETTDLAMRVCKNWKHKEALEISKHQHLASK